MNLLSFILTICLLCGCSAPRSGREEMMEVVSKSRYTLLEAKSGPRMECRVATDEEITILKDHYKQDLTSCTLWAFEAKGCHPGDTYAVYTVNLKDEAALVSSHIASDEEVSFKVLMVLGSFMKGETNSIVSVNQRTGESISVTIAPHPIQEVFDDGATISCTAVDSMMNMWYMVGKGFKPNEKLWRISKSWDEVLESEDQANSNGYFVGLQLPGVIGKMGGYNYITVERLETGEKRTIMVPFGIFAFRN